MSESTKKTIGDPVEKLHRMFARQLGMVPVEVTVRYRDPGTGEEMVKEFEASTLVLGFTRFDGRPATGVVGHQQNVRKIIDTIVEEHGERE